MKTRSLLTSLLILTGLFAASGGSYALARLLPTPVLAAAPGLPPLTNLNLPSQTQNGYTATLESYYADATRLVFKVRVTGEGGDVGNVNLYDANGDFVNASSGWGPVGDPDPDLSQIEFNPLIPLPSDHFRGQLVFAYVASPGDQETLADFQFELDLPIHPAFAFNPKQTVTANGVEILLDRIVITPAYTQVYLCYIKPSEADWMIGSDVTLRVDSETFGIGTYSLLYDSAYGDGTKGGEPDWKPPIKEGRCVKIGFPVGSKDPRSLTLTIPSLEQSTPEVIPPEDVTIAVEKLKAQGIEMTYKALSHGSTWEFQKLPAGMTQQEAYRKFIEALGYVYSGPWEFSITLK